MTINYQQPYYQGPYSGPFMPPYIYPQPPFPSFPQENLQNPNNIYNEQSYIENILRLKNYITGAIVCLCRPARFKKVKENRSGRCHRGKRNIFRGTSA